ncbi:hypothetical protein ACMGF7_24490 [Serratia sp. BNK-17]|uniref:hypothetical protein n=1 Tax=Serratia sp. BNK-17 TaxID=3376154 RepID=UPI003B43A9F1
MANKMTTERLREIAEDGFLEHGDAKLMARALLANRGAPPVGYIDPDSLKEYRGKRAGGSWSAVPRTTCGLNMTTPIYTAPPAPTAPGLGKLPPLTAELAGILGRPNFQCCHLAAAMRAGGHEIPRKAEAEQAAVIYFMLGHYLAHGEKWSEKAEEELQQLIAIGKQRADG